ncbi:MAG: hypothetical protein IMZ52_03555 [Actinobacteria bacterium]|nr:hypothetical protein [Actinomycetota bacterium]MBE3114608.1 hypothetical protein [Actinomycetota bacterium]
MSLDSYERNNSIKLTCIFKSGGIATSPISANLSVYKPDGTLFYHDVSGHRTGNTGEFYYYISTQNTNDLGIYVTEWHGDISFGSWGRLPYMDRNAFILTTIA